MDFAAVSILSAIKKPRATFVYIDAQFVYFIETGNVNPTAGGAYVRIFYHCFLQYVQRNMDLVPVKHICYALSVAKGSLFEYLVVA